MNNDYKKIAISLEEHWIDVIKNGHNPLVVALQGSQNYDLAYENSDIDTKCLIMPRFTDIIFNHKPTSTTYIRHNDEHVDIKDIRLYFEQFWKQNINFLEILFTPYVLLDNKFAPYWKELTSYKEEIAHFNEVGAVKTMYGMALEKHKALRYPYPTIKWKIDKWGYCYHKDTLFLTQNGWKTFDMIKENEAIGTVNPLNHTLEFQIPTSRIKHKCEEGYLFHFSNNFTDFMITEHHDVYSSLIKNINKNGYKYDEEKSNWKKEKVEETIKKNFHRHMLSFPINQNKDYDIDDEMLFLIGAFVSEGTINFRDNQQLKIKSLRITQTKNNLLFYNNMDIAMNKYQGKKYLYEKETVWIFNKEIAKYIYDLCGHKSELKHLPDFIYKLSVRQAKILLSALLLGDGTDKIEKEKRSIYYTCSERLANDIVSLGFLANKTTNKNGPYKCNNRFGTRPMFQVNIKERENIPFWIHTKLNGTQKHLTKVKYDNEVVCFTVPNGLLVTMFNGKTAVQGNCGKQLHHILRLEEFLRGYIGGKNFAECLVTYPKYGREMLMSAKSNKFSLDKARELAKNSMAEIKLLKDNFVENHSSEIDVKVKLKANEILYAIFEDYIKKELEVRNK